MNAAATARSLTLSRLVLGLALTLCAPAVAAQDEAPAPASQPAAPSPAAETPPPEGAHAGQAASPSADKKVVYKGSLSRKEIEDTLKSVKHQVRFCYEKRLKDQPELNGTVLVRFVISGAGAVASAEATPDPGMEDVASCTTQVVKRLKFPSPRGGGRVIVNYPYRFSPAPKTAPASDDAAPAEKAETAADADNASSADGDDTAQGSLPAPDAQPPQADEPSYFSKCCGCLP